MLNAFTLFLCFFSFSLLFSIPPVPPQCPIPRTPLFISSGPLIKTECIKSNATYIPIALMAHNFASTPSKINLNFYTYLLKEIHNKTIADPEFKNNPRTLLVTETIRQAFENHDTDITQLWHQVKDFFDLNTASNFVKNNMSLCERPECSSDELARSYESVFAATILRKRPDIPAPIKTILQKIDSGLPFATNEDKNAFINKWMADKVSPIQYFVSQKFEEPLPTLTATSSPDNVARFLDFFAYYSFLLDGPIKVSKTSCYAEIEKARGGRSKNREEDRLPERNYYGIQKNPVEALASPRLKRKWQAPYDRDTIDPKTSYVQEANKKGVPIACGISGHTNLHLWGLTSLKDEVTSTLSPQEMRTYLLALWATLCGDGGHTLQEILSSARITLNHSEKEQDPSKKKLPPALERALKEILKNVDADYESIGQYYNNFFRYFINNQPDNDDINMKNWFQELREEAWNNFMNSLPQKCHNANF